VARLLLLLLLLSVENSAAIMDWIIGTVVAWLPIRERIRRCRTILSRPVAPESRDSRLASLTRAGE
jgi:hypothetical protein